MFFFCRSWWWLGLVQRLREAIEREGLRHLLLTYIEGIHVPDDVCAVVLDECRAVGDEIKEHARLLQSEMAARLGVTLIEEWEFAHRMGRS